MISAQIRFGRAIRFVLSFLMVSLPSHAQSTAETAEAIQRDLDSIKAAFVANLQSAISNPEDLQSGQTKIGCEQILSKLENLVLRIDETIDLLAKREADLTDKVEFTDAERSGLRKTLQSQNRDLLNSKNQMEHLRKELKSLIDHKIDDIRKVYDTFFDISRQQAEVVLKARINDILNPLIPDPRNESEIFGNEIDKQPIGSSSSPIDEQISPEMAPPPSASAKLNISTSEVFHLFSMLLLKCDESLQTISTHKDTLKMLHNARDTLEASHEIKRIPHIKARMLGILKTTIKIFYDCQLSVSQMNIISKREKGALDTRDQHRDRQARLLLSAERSIQQKQQDGSMKLQKILEDWNCFSNSEINGYEISRLDPFVNILTSIDFSTELKSPEIK